MGVMTGAASRGEWRSLLGAALMALALLSSPARGQPPVPIPRPDLSSYGPSVRLVIESGLARIDELLAEESPDTRTLADAYGELGRAALFYSQTGLADACLRNAAELRPDDFRWHYYLAVHFQNERQLEEARAALERASTLQPGDGATLLRLGQVLELSGDPEAAAAFFERVEEAEPWAAAARYGLGRSAVRRGDTQAAIEHYEAALELQPNAAEVRQQLGLAYRDAGDLEAARAHLTARSGSALSFADPLVEALQVEFSNSSVYQGMKALAAGRFTEAARHYAEAVESDSANPVYRQALGGLLSTVGDLDGAVEQLEEALRLDPEKAMLRVALALALAQRDGFTDAVGEHFRIAREQAPGLKDARLGPAEAYARIGRFEEAEAELEAAIEEDPEDMDARLLWAEILLQQDRGEEAVRQLEIVVERWPKRPQVLLSYGRALSSVEEDAAASEVLQRVLEGDANPGQQSLAHLELGQTSDRLGNPERALFHYRRSARLRPESKPARIALALALADSGRHSEAAEVYSEILAVDPEDAEVRRERALSLAESGRLDEAIGELESAFEASADRQARDLLGLALATLQQRNGRSTEVEAVLRRLVEESPELPDAQFNLALVLGRRGELEGARRHLERALELDPKDAQAYLALSQLLAGTERFAEMRSTLERAHRELPDNLEIMRALTRLLVASPDRSVRDLPSALPLALKLCERQPAAGHSALVAAALAGSARFDEAVVWQTRAVAEAQEVGLDERQLSLMRQDLARYRQEAGSGDQ